MGSFDSPLGTKRFGGVGLKEFDVPDESEPTPIKHSGARYTAPNLDAIHEFQSRLDNDMGSEDQMHDISQKEKEIKEARALRKNGKERLNDGARRRIEMLVGMSRLNRSVDLDGNTYVLQTLRAKEMREVFVETAKFDRTVESPYEMRKQLVGRSLCSIAGYDIEQFLGADSVEARLAFVDEVPESLLDRLFNEYQLLVKESMDKYSIKDEVEAKEVLEDLKK